MIRRFGIDLGTTNTCIYCVTVDRTLLMMEDNESAGWSFDCVNIHYPDIGNLTNVGRTRFMPSAIYAKTDEHGKYRYYIGEVAKRMARRDDVPDLINSKRLFCRESPEQVIAYNLSAQDVAQKLLEGCWHSVFMRIWDGNEKKRTAALGKLQRSIFCVTQPAAFNIFASIAIQDAAKGAGFVNIDAQKEPTAALLSFLYDQLKGDDEKTQKMLDRQARKGKMLVLVADIGGGTTDVTIQEILVDGQYEVDEAEREDVYTGYEVQFVNETKASANQEPAFGGMDFDNIILRHLAQKMEIVYKEQNGGEAIDWTGRQGRCELARLSEQGQDYKNNLSKAGGRSAPDQEFSIFDRKIRCSASANEIYEWCSTLCESPAGSVDSDRTVYGIIMDTIKRSGYSAEEIDYVYVTGGMSQFLPIREMLERNFSALAAEGNVVFSENPLEDIARGAALCNTFFKVKMPTPTLPSDYMIDDPCGEPKIIVPKQTPLPKKDTLERFMVLRNPTSVYVDILYGNGTKESSLRKIKRVRRQLNPAMPIGTPISIHYEVDEHQALDINLTLHGEHGDRHIELLKLIDRQ